MADVVTGLEAWKAKAADGAAPADARLLKTFVPDQIKAEGSADSRRLTFTISTGAVDRDRDTLAVEGWDLQSYLANPVLLWAHDADEPPIGKALAVVKRGSALHATFEFCPPEINPFADTIYKMLLGGYLRATSVGFLPEEWAYNEQRQGFDFKKQTLLEVSVVPVPSNPQALIDAKAAGIDVEPLRGWAVKTLEGLSPEPSVWLPKAYLEHAKAETKTPPAPVVKAGRVLSQANENRVKAARDACQRACDHLDEVMSEVMPMAPEEPMDEGKAAPTPARVSPRIVVKRSRPVETEAERVARIVREVVQPTVAAEIRRLTGRLD